MSRHLVRAWALGVLLALLSTAPGSARAQGGDRDPEARGLYLAGEAAFEAGRFEDALRYFEQSYALSGRPGLLFNIGQAADRARLDAIAVDAFRRYLASDPELDAAERQRLELRIAALEAALHRGVAGEPVEPVAAAEPAEPVAAGEPADGDAVPLPEAAAPELLAAPAADVTPGPDAAGVALLVAGGVLLIGGGVMTGVGVPDTGALGMPRDGETYPEAQARQDTGSALVASGLAGLGVGAVLAAIGAAVLASGPAQSGNARLTPSGLSMRF